MEDSAEGIARIVREEVELQDRMDAERLRPQRTL